MVNDDAHEQYLIGHVALVATAQEHATGLVEFTQSGKGRHKHTLHCVEGGYAAL